MIELINSRALFINRKLGIADNVEKEDMGNFRLDLFLKLGSHLGSRGDARRAILSSRLPRVERKARIRVLVCAAAVGSKNALRARIWALLCAAGISDPNRQRRSRKRSLGVCIAFCIALNANCR